MLCISDRTCTSHYLLYTCCSPLPKKSTLNIHTNAKGFVVASGAILGICAGLLWTAQGSLMLSYPTEGQKGRFVGVFWTIFNMGSVVGASIMLGQNFHSTVLPHHVSIQESSYGFDRPMLVSPRSPDSRSAQLSCLSTNQSAMVPMYVVPYRPPREAYNILRLLSSA
jgi:hypothetical protein